MNLPPDSPEQNMLALAEILGLIVSTYYTNLIRGGVPEKLAVLLTTQYQRCLFNLYYRPAQG